MTFSRFVEIGRICVVNFGPDAGKLCTIIDLADGTKALIDGPVSKTGVPRQLIPYKQLALTDFKIDIDRKPALDALEAAFDGANVEAQWEATSWAKKLAAKKKRANLTDFDRFKLMCARKQRSKAVKAAVKKLAS